MEPRRRSRKISGKVRIEIGHSSTERRAKSFSALAGAGTHNDRAKLSRRRRPKQRHIKTRRLGLLVERSLHQRVGHYADNRSPWLRLSWVENADLMAKRALVAPVLSGKARVHDRDRLLGIDVVDRKIAAFVDLQPERVKVIIGNGFIVTARTVAVGQIILAVHFILAGGCKRHPKTIGHRSR